MSLPTRILLVEDNPVDVRTIRFALNEETTWSTEITVAEDGELAIKYLLESDGNLDLIILDLNIPKCDGIDVLRVVRSTPRLASLPVIILSSLPENISERQVRNENLSADAYLRKPVGASEFRYLGEWVREAYKQATTSAGKRERSRHAG